MEEELKINIIPTAAANSESMGGDLLKEIVAKFDANGNGKMSNSEMKELLLQFPVSMEEEVDRVVTEMDGDGDGVIRFDQFIGFLRKEEIRYPIKCSARSISLTSMVESYARWNSRGVELSLLPLPDMPINPKHRVTFKWDVEKLERELEYSCFPTTDGADRKVPPFAISYCLHMSGYEMHWEDLRCVMTELLMDLEDNGGGGAVDLKRIVSFFKKEVFFRSVFEWYYGGSRNRPPLAPAVTAPGTHEVNNLPPPRVLSLMFSSFLNKVRSCLPKVYAVKEEFSPLQTVDYLYIPLEYKSTAIGGGKYMEEKLEKAFACFDTDGDGKISAIEVKSVLSSLGRVISLEEAQRITTEIDKDGDGLADLKDLTGFLRKDVCIDVEGSFAFDTIPEAYRYAKWMKEPEMAIAYPTEPIYIPGGTCWDAKAAADDYEKWMKEPEMAIAYPTEPVHNRGGTWWEAKAAAAAKVLAKFATAGCAAAVLTLLASDLPRDYAWIAIGVALVIPLCAVSLA